MGHSQGRVCYICRGRLCHICKAIGAGMKRIVITLTVLVVLVGLLWWGLSLIPPDKAPVTTADKEVASTNAVVLKQPADEVSRIYTGPTATGKSPLPPPTS